VSRTKEKGLIATVPVAGGGEVSAGRITPVMEDGRVRFDVHFVYGRYPDVTSSKDLKRLPAKLISSRVVAKDETLVLRDNVSANAPWFVSIKAVELRGKPVTGGKNLESLLQPSIVPFMSHYTSSTQDLEVEESSGCGCAYCGELMVCPAKGKCIHTYCGDVCCPQG
jgi:hypothetical protein